MTRKIDDIKRDIDKTTGCMLNRHSCDNNCEQCDYLNYDKNWFKLKEENYQWYQNQDKRKAAIEGIDTEVLTKICNAIRENRVIITPHYNAKAAEEEKIVLTESEFKNLVSCGFISGYDYVLSHPAEAISAMRDELKASSVPYENELWKRCIAVYKHNLKVAGESV